MRPSRSIFHPLGLSFRGLGFRGLGFRGLGFCGLGFCGLGFLVLMPAIFGRRSGGGAPVDWLIVGLGNPGAKYARTRHNVGYMVCEALIERYDLGKTKSRYRGEFVSGRLGPGGPRVAVLMPQTFMNESGKSVGPARGELK
ncbi:MAG: aminoacyl-tRNA hydrolase, partial [Solirubrobacterales bacterium]